MWTPDHVCGSSTNCYQRDGSTQQYRMSVYPVALQLPFNFTGTKMNSNLCSRMNTIPTATLQNQWKAFTEKWSLFVTAKIWNEVFNKDVPMWPAGVRKLLAMGYFRQAILVAEELDLLVMDASPSKLLASSFPSLLLFSFFQTACATAYFTNRGIKYNSFTATI